MTEQIPMKGYYDLLEETNKMLADIELVMLIKVKI